jgi:PRC-barrel domain protein
VRAMRFVIGVILAASCLFAIPKLLPAADTPQSEAPPAAPESSATIIDGSAVRGILGRNVQGADGKVMGRVVDIIVGPTGQVRAAIIDFGGFLGVGSRKIAVDWNALHFHDAFKGGGDLKLELTQDQLAPAPEYKEGKPVVVIGSTGALAPLDFPTPEAPEK